MQSIERYFSSAGRGADLYRAEEPPGRSLSGGDYRCVFREWWREGAEGEERGLIYRHLSRHHAGRWIQMHPRETF